MHRMPLLRRLSRDLGIGLFVLLTAGLVYNAVDMTRAYGLGWDAHAYYVAWHGGLYDVAPGHLDAYNYSPLFAQVVWPLTNLPWPLFCALFIGGAAVTIAWLVRPLSLPMAVAMWLFCTPEILSGNVFWLLALATVLGFTRGSPWCVAAFTKVLPCLGPVWFLLRGEWRHLAGFVATAAVLLTASVALDPSLWRQWFDFLRDNAGDSPSMIYVPPVLWRLPLAAVLLGYAARTDRRWLLPVSMLLACPVVGWGSFALLAAIPRLRDTGRTAAVGPDKTVAAPGVPAGGVPRLA
jgi:hypothetical protein